MTEEYHTPKDLVNKQPLTIGLQVLTKNDVSDETYANEPIQRKNSNAADNLNKVIFTPCHTICYLYVKQFYKI